MLNTAFIGRTLPATTPVTVTAEAANRFAAALGDQVRDSVVPATFLVSVTLPAANVLFDDPDFGLDFSRVLHREQRFEYHRPLRVGDAITSALTVESIKTVAGSEVLALRSDVASADGEPIAAVWTTLFVAGDA